MRKLFLTILIVLLLPQAVHAMPKADRFFGQSPVPASIGASQADYEQSDMVMLVRGDGHADLTVAMPISSTLNVPLLIADKNVVTSPIVNEIVRLRPKRILIVGGTTGISTVAEKSLGEDYEVIRIAGANRYETSALLNAYAYKMAKKAIVVDGRNLWDCVTIITYAMKERVPVVFAHNTLPTVSIDLLRSLGIKNTLVVGGTRSVGDHAFASLPNPVRIAGKDRFETSELFAKQFFPDIARLIVTAGSQTEDVMTALFRTKEFNRHLLLSSQSRGALASMFPRLQHIIFQGSNLKSSSYDPIDPVVYYVPHPDDESLSMGTAIRADIEDGREVYVVMLTHGRKSSTRTKVNQKLIAEGYSPLTVEEFGNARINEVRLAVQRLGVPEEHLIIKDQTDGFIRSEDVYLLAKEMRSKFGAIHHKTLSNSPFERHPDHLAAASGIAQISRESGDPATFYEGSVFGYIAPLYPIVPASAEISSAAANALRAFSIWDPENDWYSIGLLSVESGMLRDIKSPNSQVVFELNR